MSIFKPSRKKIFVFIILIVILVGSFFYSISCVDKACETSQLITIPTFIFAGIPIALFKFFTPFLSNTSEFPNLSIQDQNALIFIPIFDAIAAYLIACGIVEILWKAKKDPTK
jgi:hypothetical protein